MPKQSLKNQYSENGYLTGLRAINETRARKLLIQFENEKSVARQKGLIEEEFIYKPHLMLKDFNDLIFEPAITEAVKTVLGSDIVCWNTMLFYKQKGQFVGFHQDLQYWEFINSKCLTVLLALTKSTVSNGCLSVIPASHSESFSHQKNKELSNNMLVYSQEVNVNDLIKVPLELDPGEFSIHHGDLVHGSESNGSDSPRVLLAMRYCSSDNISKIYSTGSWPESKNYKKFEKEPRIISDFGQEGLKFREKLLNELTVKHASKLAPLFSFEPFKTVVGWKTSRKFYYGLIRFKKSIKSYLAMFS